MAAILIPVTPSKERPSLSEARSTPAASHPVAPVSLSSTAALAVFEKKPAACRTRLEQLELEFLMALHALRTLDSESGEDRTTFHGRHCNRTHKFEELQSQHSLAREKYKSELWNQDFEPVLQRIRVAVAATTNGESTKSEAVRRLVASGVMVQKEKDVLNGLLGECTRMKNILGNVGHFLGMSSTAGERCDSLSDDHGTREDTDTEAGTQTQSLWEEELATINRRGLEPTSKPNSMGGDGVDFHCDALPSTPPVQANGDPTTLQTDTNPAHTSKVVKPLMTTQLYAHIPMAQIWAENAALGMLLDREREKLNTTFAEMKRRSEEDLSLAADLLIETVEVQAETERVRAATKVDLGVSVKIREEAERRKSAARHGSAGE